MEFFGKAKERIANMSTGLWADSKKEKREQSVHGILDDAFKTECRLTPPDHNLQPAHRHNGTRSLASSSRAVPSSVDEAIATVLDATTVDINSLRKLCWNGTPQQLRTDCWALLAGYHPAAASMRVTVVKRKRAEYWGYIQHQYRGVDWEKVLESAASGAWQSDAIVGDQEVSIMRQLRKDVPRTTPAIRAVHFRAVQAMLERILYIWSIRHPASGYVQGMNDLVVPFIIVFLAAQISPNRSVYHFLGMSEEDCHRALEERISQDLFNEIEADVYWCASRLLSSVQNNYTFSQAGAHDMVKRLEEVVLRIDQELHVHLTQMDIAFPEFAFRWVNCFLLRELPPALAVRLWDTYICEDDTFADLHVYVCAALLKRWSATLRASGDYAYVMQFLQSPPTLQFSERDLEEVIACAFVLQQQFQDAPGHLQS